MTYAEKQLAPGERILYRARYHWIFFGKAILLLLLSIVLSGIDLWMAQKGVDPAAVGVLKWAAAAVLVFALVFLLARSIRAAADEFVVTDRRIIHKLGFFSHETRQCPLARVQDITVDQSFWGRLLGYGDLGIETASEGDRSSSRRSRIPKRSERPSGRTSGRAASRPVRRRLRRLRPGPRRTRPRLPIASRSSRS